MTYDVKSIFGNFKIKIENNANNLKILFRKKVKYHFNDGQKEGLLHLLRCHKIKYEDSEISNVNKQPFWEMRFHYSTTRNIVMVRCFETKLFPNPIVFIQHIVKFPSISSQIKAFFPLKSSGSPILR